MSPSSCFILAPVQAAHRMRGALLAATAAAVLALPAPAAAQFTTGVSPPAPRGTPAVEDVIAAERARVDTIAVRERLDLRAWVDSAAQAIERGESPVTPIPVQPGDTLQPVEPADRATAPAPVRPTEPLPRATTVFREGAPAPATATPLPLLILAGAGLLVAGSRLRRRR